MTEGSSYHIWLSNINESFARCYDCDTDNLDIAKNELKRFMLANDWDDRDWDNPILLLVTKEINLDGDELINADAYEKLHKIVNSLSRQERQLIFKVLESY